MPFRVLTYQQRIWAASLRAEPTRKSLPPILTVIVHHGEGGWTSPRRLHSLIEGLEETPALAPFVPDFELLIDDLRGVDDAALQQRPLHAFPKITLWLLRDGRSNEAFLEHLAAWGAELERLALEDPGREDVTVILRYILRVAGDVPYEIALQRIAEVAPTIEENMATFEEQLIQRGFERGEAEGLEKGLQKGLEGIREMLLRQLRLRFGPLGAVAEERMMAASRAELERWADRTVMAERIDDVFAE